MIKIIKLTQCPITGLPISVKPEWTYNKNDFRVEYTQIGENIILYKPVGNGHLEAADLFHEIIAGIIEDKNHENGLFYLIGDFSGLTGASLALRQKYINWLLYYTNRFHRIIFFGMSPVVKTIVKSGKSLSPTFHNFRLVSDYESAMEMVMNHKSGNLFEEDEEEEASRGKELLGYLAQMTWRGNYEQEIPLLPEEDPFSGLFSAVSLAQIDLRFIHEKKLLEIELLNKDKLILKQEQELVQRELTSKAMRMAEKQEIIIELSKDIRRLQSHNTNGEDITKFIQKKLNHYLGDQTDWDEFENWFQKVHGQFYDDLSKRYPDLSSREQKICAFLKLKMQSKDIARLTNLVPKSIDQYRYNIRKKMGISRKENLYTTLNNI